MALKRGSVILVQFPFTDLSNYKARPALVVSSTQKADIILAFISSVVPKEIASTDFKINQDSAFFQTSGLKTISVIKCDKLMTLSRSIVLGELGKLPEEIMKNEINKRLKIALSLS